MYKTLQFFINPNGDICVNQILVGHYRSALDEPDCPFGSRNQEETAEKIDAVLNGRFWKLPFGICLITKGK